MLNRSHGYYFLIALVIGLDQLSKHLILTNLNYGQHIPITSFFDLVLFYNPGAAFSFLANHSGWQRWFFIILALAICTWLIIQIRVDRNNRMLCLSYSLITGGALGNVIDRLQYGAVVDFIYLYVGRWAWPAFNIADSAICLGVILMLIGQFRTPAIPVSSKAQN